MKYFLDTEFIDDGHRIDLLSIGIVSEDNREFYIENGAAQWDKASEWVMENVIKEMHEFNHKMKDNRCMTSPCPVVYRKIEIKWGLEAFVAGDKDIEFWGYYADYDWVALCQLFGPMVKLPKYMPKFCYDLRQALDHCGWSKIKQPDNAPHHALLDAHWIQDTYVNYIKGQHYVDFERIK